MLDWVNYQKELQVRVGQVGRLSPETLKGYMALSQAGAKTGQLDAKTRELMALAVAVALRCDGCITVHAAQAAKLGATEAEVAEALGVAVAISAGAAMVYSARTLDALAAHQAAGQGA
ncbi:MAG: carboxymuconolactone decarboxylase family protein [Paucibacter sp.]|nr:carboxymuconolactone decarboxylase family protein [Roseateles sp.]